MTFGKKTLRLAGKKLRIHLLKKHSSNRIDDKFYEQTKIAMESSDKIIEIIFTKTKDISRNITLLSKISHRFYTEIQNSKSSSQVIENLDKYDSYLIEIESNILSDLNNIKKILKRL